MLMMNMQMVIVFYDDGEGEGDRRLIVIANVLVSDCLFVLGR